MNHPSPLSGVIAPMFTPVREDRSLDERGAVETARWLVEQGCVRSVFVRSGMGKMFSFTLPETRQLATWVRRALPSHVGMIVGCAGEWLDKGLGYPDPTLYTKQACELTRWAADTGADASVHVLPSALAESGIPPAEAIVRYVQAVHDAAEIPIVLYQPGGMPQEFCLTPDLLRRLMELPRVAGLKLSTTDRALFEPIAKVAGARPFSLICGHEGYYQQGLALGAVGVIGQGAMAYPEILECVELAILAGDATGATDAQQAVERALECTSGLDSVVALKQYFARKGYEIGPWDRSPKPPYSDDVIDRLEASLDAVRAPYIHRVSMRSDDRD